MIAPRLLELRARLQAAERGREVLERRRELLLVELRRRASLAAAERSAFEAALAKARASLAAARVELGALVLDGAALAQPPSVSVERRAASLLGVPVPRLSLRAPPHRPAWGPLAGAASLDRAGAAFAALLPALVSLAEREAEVAALRLGMRRAARRLGALERVVLPELRAAIDAAESAIEEEERDEHIRRRTWLSSRSAASPTDAP